MLSKLWALVPLEVRMGLFAVIGLGMITTFLWLSYKIHNYDNLVSQNKIMSDELVKSNVLIAQIQKDNATLKTGRDNALQHIKKTGSKDHTPAALLDTINGLSIDPE